MRALHALGIHPRLKKRPVDVDFVEDLAVGVVEAFGQQREVVVVRERRSVPVLSAHHGAARVAARAGFELRPLFVALETDLEALRVFGRVLGPALLDLVRPFHML